MKLKKYLSVFLIALMATTVVSAAGVLTAQKAAAQPTGVTPIDVRYTPGKTYVFLPWRYNVHWVDFTATGGTPHHFEFSKVGTVYSSIKTAPTQEGGSFAEVGTRWRVLGITANDLNDNTKTCTVTMKVSYKVAARGDGFTGAQFWTSPHTAVSTSVWGTDANHVKFGTRTVKCTVPLYEIFGFDTRYPGDIVGEAGVNALAQQGTNGINPPAVTGQATASVTVYYITLTFN